MSLVGKVTKIFLKIVAAIILLLLLSPIAASLLLSMPSVQNRAVQIAADFATEKLGTRVGIEYITVGMLNRIKVRGFYVEDLDKDTLLYAGSVSAMIAPLSSMTGGISLLSGRVENGVLYLRDTERGEINIREVTDRIIDPNRKRRDFRLDISTLDAKNIDFRLERDDDREYESGVDYTDMYLQGINARIYDFYVDNGAVGGDVEALDFYEKSGFVLDNMKGEFYVNKGLITIKQGKLEAKDTQINIPDFALTGDDWDSYHDFINQVRLDIDITDSYTTSETVGYFAPSILPWQTSVTQATASMHGTVADFDGAIDNLCLEDGGVLSARAKVKGLIDVNRTHFDVSVDKADLTTKELLRLLGNIAHLDVPEKVVPYIERTERVKVNGKFVGRISSFDASANVSVASGGELTAQCAIRPDGDINVVSATVDADSIIVNRLLAVSKPLTTSFTVKGTASFGDVKAAMVSGNIRDLLFHGYNYQDISFDGTYSPTIMTANVGSNDKSMKGLVQAVVNREYERPTYHIKADIEHADLCAVNINHRDSLSTVKATVSLEAVGKTFDDMDGKLSIVNGLYCHNDKQVTSDLIEVELDSNEDIRRMNLTSDFADVIFESGCPYKDVVYYVSTLLSRYLPKLYDSTALDKIESKQEVIKDNVALLSVTTKNISPLLDCFVDGVEIAPSSTVRVLMDPVANRFVLKGSSECIESYPYLISGITLSAGNKNDSLVVDIGSSELWAGVMRLSDISLHGGAKHNEVDLYGEFADTLYNATGQLAANVKVSRRNGLRHLAVNILPSRLKSDRGVWRISSDGIYIDSTRIDVQSLRAFNSDRGEGVELDGIASREYKDSLQLRLTNFSLSPLSRFTKRLGYGVDAQTNGYVSVRSALKGARVGADIAIDSIRVNGIALPDLNVASRWDVSRSRAGLFIKKSDDGKEVGRGYFSPTDSRYYANINMGLSIALLDPLLSGVISDTQGLAMANLTLNGEGRDARLNGEILVSDMQTTLDYTKCRYTAPKARIEVKNNRFHLQSAPIYDLGKRSGSLSMDLNLNHLSNIEYNISAQFEEMKVLGTTKKDNEMFYGDIYASGSIDVHGDRAGVKMDIVGVSGDNSKFVMPLSDNSNITWADFVTFKQPEVADTTSYLVRKKQMFERRQRKRYSSSGNMDINMSLDVRENAKVQLVIDPTVGDIIEGTGNGLLDLKIRPQDDIFEMYGLYTINEGSYLFTLQNIINKKFVIEKGSTIRWTGDPLDALLDIAAVYKVKASLQPLLEGYVDTSVPNRAVPVNCIINLTDRLTKPSVGFDVQVPSADASIQSVIANVLSTPERRSQQFLYLLLANSFLSDSSTEASSFGISSAAVTGFELLSNQLSNWLSSENFNIVLRYRPKSEEKMTDEVDFGFSQSLLGNRLLIEVEGNYLGDRSQVVNATSSFTGEAYLTWMIDKSGALQLKGFSHTIDRFDENQGLQEYGVGVYFKEDFNDAKDFKNRVVNRFSRRRRQENREKIAAALGLREEDNEAQEAMRDDFEAPLADDVRDNYD